MAERGRRDGSALLDQVLAALQATLHDPRRLAEALIREQLPCSSRFLGEGTRECPWMTISDPPSSDLYAFYVRDRELVQKVNGQPDEVVCVL